MVYIKLEKPAKEQIERIVCSRLYIHCKDIAKKLGKKIYESRNWASAQYVFEDKSLKIDFEIYAMADEELRVFYRGKKVLLLDEICNTPPKPGNPVIKVDKWKRFEVQTYERGAWQKRVDKLHAIISKK